ncbi:hypothetical protein EHP00_2361 [Ecytonucleospora hepatopenaei]|uniref:Uncharacterized protein n=1 Tax=Ecytonucleospora hepatopenaei TaxID=646526 RepID=A0A1W0E7P0_9MICR|nr:hypothetical protein EHP00_2361 [Ecytonucleospora hepatopenaei]
MDVKKYSKFQGINISSDTSSESSIQVSLPKYDGLPKYDEIVQFLDSKHSDIIGNKDLLDKAIALFLNIFDKDYKKHIFKTSKIVGYLANICKIRDEFEKCSKGLFLNQRGLKKMLERKQKEVEYRGMYIREQELKMTVSSKEPRKCLVKYTETEQRDGQEPTVLKYTKEIPMKSTTRKGGLKSSSISSRLKSSSLKSSSSLKELEGTSKSNVLEAYKEEYNKICKEKRALEELQDKYEEYKRILHKTYLLLDSCKVKLNLKELQEKVEKMLE